MVTHILPKQGTFLNSLNACISRNSRYVKYIVAITKKKIFRPLKERIKVKLEHDSLTNEWAKDWYIFIAERDLGHEGYDFSRKGQKQNNEGKNAQKYTKNREIYYHFWKMALSCMQQFHAWNALKFASAIFYQIFIFSPNDNPLKTMRNIFYFI